MRKVQTIFLIIVFLWLVPIATLGQSVPVRPRRLTELRLLSTNGSNYISLAPREGLSLNYNIQFPLTAPTNNALLFVTAANDGHLAWTTGTPGNGDVLGFSGGVPTWITPSSGWALTGNASTTAGTNFIGTTDAVALVMKTNNTERLRILSTGAVGIGTSSPTELLDVLNGNIMLSNSDNTARELRFDEPSGSGSNYTGFKAGVQSANVSYTLPTGAPSSDGQVLSSSTAGVMSWVTPTSALSGISAASASNTIDNTNYAQTWQWNTLPSANALTLSSTSTSAASSSTGQTILNIALSGANSSGVTSYGMQVSNTHTGTSSTNIGGYFTASGGTNNYGLIVAAGNVGIGTTSPASTLDITGTLNASGNTTLGGTLAVTSTSTFTGAATFMAGGTFNNTVNLGPYGSSAGNTSDIRLIELAANGTEYVGFKAPDAITANKVWTLPAQDGSNGQVLSTNGSGTLSWASLPGSGTSWGLQGNSGTTPATNYLGTADAQALVFRTNAVERVRLLSTGEVGIGTTTPTSTLHVSSSGTKTANFGTALISNTATTNTGSTVKTGLEIQSTGSWTATGAVNRGLYVNATGGTTNYSALFDGGNVGIGITAPLQLLHLNNGNLLIDNTNNTAGELRLEEPSSGGVNYTAFKAGVQAADVTYTLPIAAPSISGQVLSSTTAGVMSWISSGAAFSALTAAGTTNTIDNASFAQTWQWNTLGAASALTLSSTSTSATNNSTTQTLLNVTLSGANGAGITSYGTQVSNTHTGVNSTNIAGYFTASGATNNYGLIVAAGNVGVGTTAPGSTLDVKGTLRLSGSSSGYVGFAPAAAAGTTTYTLPSADGTSGQLLSTNGAGTLSWTSSLSNATIATPTITFSTNNAVTAGTNAQGQGALTSDYNVITTASNNPSGVTLPTATTGRRVIIVNKGANAVNVYPATGATIDALTANASVSIPVAGYMEFNASSTTQWYSTSNLTASGSVTSFSGGTTGLTPAGTTTGAVTLGGTLVAANGGTGLSSYTTGDLLYASGATTIAKLADVATGNVLISGGVGVAPSWGKVDLTAAVSGTLPVANGGTGVTSSTGSGSVVLSTSPTLVTPNLGTPSAIVLTSGTGLPISTGVSGLGTGIATMLATPSSANLATAITDETGTGALVFGTSPTIATPTITFSTNNAVTAGTNAQGQGALTSDYNVITTASSNPSGVTLPTATTGRRVIIVNKGANAVNVYPATGAAIDALAANASVSIPVAGYMEFIASSTTQWYSTSNLTASGAAVTSFSGGTTGLTPAGTTTGAVTLAGTLVVANGGTGVTTSTGSGSVVLSTSPTLVTPILGTPTSATLTNATGLPISTGVTGLASGIATMLATPSSANVAAAVTDETGTGALVFATSPTLVTPNLGTPSSATLTNATGLPITTGVSGLGTNVATMLATPSSANVAAAVTDETGSGALVFGTSPTIATPAITFSTTSNVTAGTNAQGQGALTSDYNVITTASSNPSGVTLPTATTGRRVIIVNKGANAVSVFPATSASIDALAANASVSIPVAGYMEFIASSTTQWYSTSNLTASGAAVTSFSAGSTGLTPSAATTGAVTLGGTLAVANGGTGLTSYTTGDLVYASTTNTLAKLADVATGNVLISGGVGVAPSWGKVDLTAAVSGTLPVANGGTGLTSYAVGDLLYASGATTIAKLADVATGNVLISGGVGVAPSWGKVDLTTAVTGTLPVANGGTGVTSSTGSGSVVLSTSPTLVTPNLGTPSALTLTNATGLPINGITGLGTGVGAWLTSPTSANLVTAITDETGSGALVFGTSPTIATPTITFSTNNAVTAGTNAQGQGALTSDYNVITTAGSSPSGVTLPTATTGRRVIIVNKGANTVNVYPATGAAIDALAANASVSIPVAGYMEFNASSTTQWYSTSNLAASGAAVTSFSGGTTGLTPAGTTTGAVTLAGTLVAANGGTGLTSYAVGDLLYASGASTIAKLADVATGNVLISGGVGVAPSWGRVDLTAAVSNTLPAANGGTGLTSYTTGDLLYASGATTIAKLADVATGSVLISGGIGSAPSWGKVALATAVSGILPVANGGTGSATQNFVDLTTAQTSIGGAKTFTSALSASAGATISGGTTSINDNSNNITNINTGTSTGTVNIGGTGVMAINIGTGGTGAKTITIGDGASTGAITLAPGTGGVTMSGTATLTNATALRLSEATANGTNYVAFKGANNLAANTTWTLPTADGTNGQFLSTDGAGNLSFTSVVGGVASTGTANYVTKFTSASAVANSVLYDNGTNIAIGTTIPGATLDIRGSAAGTIGLLVRAAASATANIFDVQNSSSTSLLNINSSGNLSLGPTGTGAGATNEIRFLELAAKGANYVGFKAPDSLAADKVWTLPSADGTSGDVLTTNGSGVTSWSTLRQRTVFLTSNETASGSATLISATGLETTVDVGTYKFEYNVIYQSSNTGNGIGFAVDHSGTVTRIVATHRYTAVTPTVTVTTGTAAGTYAGPPTSAGAATTNSTGTAALAYYEAMSVRAKNTLIGAVTTSVDAANSDMYSVVEGIVTVTASGTLKLLYRSETGGTNVQIMAGTSLVLTKLN